MNDNKTQNLLYSLNNSDNYKSNLNTTTICLLRKYNLLIIEYLNFININNKFVIIRGLTTITHVFNIILYYTRNIDVALYHGQKSFYYYVEFISQITDEDNLFLNLNSRDASLFVYKKTIYEINKEFKEAKDKEKEFKEAKDKEKEFKEEKDKEKEFKEAKDKEKEFKEAKDKEKEFKEAKDKEKEFKEATDKEKEVKDEEEKDKEKDNDKIDILNMNTKIIKNILFFLINNNFEKKYIEIIKKILNKINNNKFHKTLNAFNDFLENVDKDINNDKYISLIHSFLKGQC